MRSAALVLVARARRLLIDGADLTDRTPLDGLPDGWGFDWHRWKHPIGRGSNPPA